MQSRDELRNELNAFKLEDIIQESPYAGLDTAQTSAKILTDFNQERPSIMTHSYFWLFTHQLIKPNQFRLVEKNGVPELVGFSNMPLRLKKYLSFSVSTQDHGTFDQNTPLIGANGHYVINVPPGKFAKIFDGNSAKILGSGQHVIHSDNFRFNPETDLVEQNAPYIQHNDLHVLRVPEGKVAIVRLNNQSMFLEHRKEPYVFKTQQFIIEKNNNNYFFNADAKKLQSGTKLRIIPDVGEIGIVNTGGHFNIITPKPDQTGPITQDILNARFDGFLSTTLQNVEFPSESIHQQHLNEGVQRADANFDYFYTADQVKVGVRFLVNYRIKDPLKTLEHLTLADIRPHIESVVTADMGNAIKQTSMQNLLASSMSSIKEGNMGDMNHWQDIVKTQLQKDFGEYGIELVRLNIEEAKILNPEIEQQMSQQATSYTKTQVQQQSLQAELAIKKAQAAQERELAVLRQTTEAEVKTLQAKNEVDTAQLRANAKAIDTGAEANRQKQLADVMEKSPQAAIMSFMQIFASALQGGNFSSALPLSDLNQLFAALMSQLKGIIGSKQNLLSSQSMFGAEESSANSSAVNRNQLN